MRGLFASRMNPQTIVNIGFVILASGIAVAAWDPLKPEPEPKPIVYEFWITSEKVELTCIDYDIFTCSLSAPSALSDLFDDGDVVMYWNDDGTKFYIELKDL